MVFSPGSRLADARQSDALGVTANRDGIVLSQA